MVALLAAPAWGATCQPKEYAQYKDDGRSAFQRQLQALEYCRLNEFANIELKAAMRDEGQAAAARHMAEAERCHGEMAKIMSVFVANHDAKAQKAAAAGCPKPPG